MRDEYKFHIEEDFSLDLLVKGVEKIIKENEMSVDVNYISENKYIITSTNIRGKGNRLFHQLSGTVFSLSILLEVEEDCLKVMFSDKALDDKGLAFLIGIGIPVFAFSAGYG